VGAAVARGVATALAPRIFSSHAAALSRTQVAMVLTNPRTHGQQNSSTTPLSAYARRVISTWP